MLAPRLEAHELPPPLPPALSISKQCVFVVGAALPLSLADAAIHNLLGWLCGGGVELLTAAEFEAQPARRTWPRVALAVISGSCGSRSAAFAAGSGGPLLPILALGSRWAWSALALAQPESLSWVAPVAALHIESDASPAALHLRRGYVPIYEQGASGGAALLAGTPCNDDSATGDSYSGEEEERGDESPAAVLVATPSLAPPSELGSFLAYGRGALLCGSVRAPARRVALGLSTSAFAGGRSSSSGGARVTSQVIGLVSSAALWLSGASPSHIRRVVRAVDEWTVLRASSASATRQMFEYSQAREIIARMGRADKAEGSEREAEDAEDAEGEDEEAVLLRVMPPQLLLQRECTLSEDGAQSGAQSDVQSGVQSGASARGNSTRGASSGPPFAHTAVADCSSDVVILLHTCDAYSKFWAGWSATFARQWPHLLGWPLAFCNEGAAASPPLQAVRSCGTAAEHAPTERGAFSTRLLHALRHVQPSSPLVLYLQEDAWLRPDGPPAHETAALLTCARSLILNGTFDGIRLEGTAPLASGLYHVEESGHTCGGRSVYRFLHGRNRWLFSHQPGLWRRAALLEGNAAAVIASQAEQQHGQQAGGGPEAAQVAAQGETQHRRLASTASLPAVVQPGENPWLNELVGSQRAEARELRVGLLVVEWYSAVASSGALTPEGRAMLRGT